MSMRIAGLASGMVVWAAWAFCPPAADAQVTARLESAVAVFDEVTTMGGLKKGAFVVGAKYGRGFVACRSASGWSAPAGIIVEGGSVGFQVGGTEIDVVLAIMNKRGVSRLLSNKFTLGADASVAAGPLGRTAAAQTDAAMTAEILSWSKSRGVFAGVALEGATLRGDEDANRDLYGKKLTVRDIVTGEVDVFVPPSARPLIERLSKY
jgi:lipid-binding SYLF domain-containing protein